LECRLEWLSGDGKEASSRVEGEGGIVLGCYSDPLGKNPLLLAILPIGCVEPTPFQRDLSQAHHRRLADVIDRTGLFLDPVIAVTAPGKGFWTPNGRHRLEAMRRLGARAITALVVPQREIAWQILALNTEKAHNLRERALEVIRIYRGLIEEDGARLRQPVSARLRHRAHQPAALDQGRAAAARGSAEDDARARRQVQYRQSEAGRPRRRRRRARRAGLSAASQFAVSSPSTWSQRERVADATRSCTALT